jgi:hypothetical protein
MVVFLEIHSGLVGDAITGIITNVHLSPTTYVICLSAARSLLFLPSGIVASVLNQPSSMRSLTCSQCIMKYVYFLVFLDV